MVCVKLLDALEILRVPALPIVIVGTLIVEARGIVLRVPDPEPDFVPIDDPLNVIPNSWENE